jgi:hypothetical protein
VFPNLEHLHAALEQFGPWANETNLTLDRPWLELQLTQKIKSLDWEEAKKDVRRFLRPEELKSLQLWCEPFFLAKLQKLMQTPI